MPDGIDGVQPGRRTDKIASIVEPKTFKGTSPPG